MLLLASVLLGLCLFVLALVFLVWHARVTALESSVKDSEHWVAHCGHWQLVTTLPQVCGYCQKELLGEVAR